MKAEDLEKSEAMFQAEFYHQARKIGLPVFLEFATPVGRLDIVVFNRPMDSVVAIIECKRNATLRDRLQADAYLKIGAPLFWCCSMRDARVMPPAIKARYYEFSGVKIDQILRMRRISAKDREAPSRSESDAMKVKRVDRWMEHLRDSLLPTSLGEATPAHKAKLKEFLHWRATKDGPVQTNATSDSAVET